MLLETLMNLPPAAATLLTLLASIFVFSFFTKFWSSLFSPGPWGLPIVGYYPFLRNDFYRQLQELTKKYGEVYTINIGGQNFVYLGSIRAIKEAHIHKPDYFTGRTHKYSLIQMVLADGLAMMEGDEWKAQRKFFVQSLREAGHNRNLEAITEAVERTLEELHNTNGEAFKICPTLSVQTNAVVRRVMIGSNVSDKTVADIKAAFFEMAKGMAMKNFLLIGNFAKYFLFSRIAGIDGFKSGCQKIAKLLTEIVEEHKVTYDPEQCPRDFIDMYIREREMRKKKGDPLYKAFTDAALVTNLRQAYGDGSEAVAIFLASFLIHLSSHRDVQDSIYDEIVRVIGTERPPTMEDRFNLPLIQSAFKELQRLTKFMTAGPGLECTKDTEIFGVKVPKGYIALINFWAVHHDPENYENPEKFDVTRFMLEKGKVEQPITFGVGRRACAGETFVMNEIFLFFTAIVQNFVILPETDDQIEDEGEPFPDLDVLFQSKIRVVPRKRVTPTTP